MEIRLNSREISVRYLQIIIEPPASSKEARVTIANTIFFM